MNYYNLKEDAKVWYFHDGYLPKNDNSGFIEGHEALMLLNSNETTANISLDLYFEDKPPIINIETKVQAERVLCNRLDNPAESGGVIIPALYQYSIPVRSDIIIIALFERFNVGQQYMASYRSMGYFESI